jgi:hypothetical protein
MPFKSGGAGVNSPLCRHAKGDTPHAHMHTRYRGRPLALLAEAERREIGSKISKGLWRYNQQHHKRSI